MELVELPVIVGVAPLAGLMVTVLLALAPETALMVSGIVVSLALL
jgi:hypothetical protein